MFMPEVPFEASEDMILLLNQYKTARYTIETPLQMGYTLGGEDSRQLPLLSAYAIPLRVAFQLRDDILGLSGEDKQIGRPACSDLQEGKVTLSILKALEIGSLSHCQKILTVLGKVGASRIEVETVS